jgi:thymidylate synthase (FAD)
MSKTKLIWITPDAEALITYIARVSAPENQIKQLELENPEKMISTLIGYLIKNKHWSPFDMVNVCFEINTTRAISAQIIRHSSFKFQEFSQRYTAVNKLDRETPEMRYKGATNRQSSLPKEKAGKSRFTDFAVGLIRDLALKVSYTAYDLLLRMGVANESARMILPMSAPTRLYMNGTLRSWIHYLQVRNEPGHTQAEHVGIAQEINETLSGYFPLTWGALDGDV